MKYVNDLISPYSTFVREISKKIKVDINKSSIFLKKYICLNYIIIFTLYYYSHRLEWGA